MPKSSTAMRTPSSLMARSRWAVAVGVAHEGGFGDLDDQRGGVETAHGEGVADVLDDGVVVELAARDVDRDVEGVAPGVPGGHLLAGLAQHPAADLADLAGLLEDRDELVGLDQTPGRVLPAQQRLDADQGEVVEVVDRLVDEAELVARQRRAQIELELDAAADVGLHLRVEDLVAVLAGGLGLVERHVGVAQQLAGRWPGRRWRCRCWC